MVVCAHTGPFTVNGSNTGYRWHCLVCDEVSRPYCTHTDCVMDFTRVSRKLSKEVA